LFGGVPSRTNGRRDDRDEKRQRIDRSIERPIERTKDPGDGDMSVREATTRAALAASTALASPHALRVHFSNRYVYAQIVRASDGHVVASASTIERGFDEASGTIGRPRGVNASGGGGAARAVVDAAATRRVSRSDKRAAAYVGKTLAERAKAAEVERVRWNRPYGQRYHGKVRAMLEELVGGGVGVDGGKASRA
jgi:large subunit ribosomal protein L18